jgi:hypothetical protein
MRRFQNIDIEIIIHKNGAAHGGDPDCFLPDFKKVNRLCNQSVGDPVMTSRTEVERDVNQTFWTFKDKLHFFSNTRKGHRAKSIEE